MSFSPETELHFVAALGIELETVDGHCHVYVDLDPAMRAPGSGALRLGLLTTFVDFAAGMTPHGPINPTVDIRTTLLRPALTSGRVHVVGRPLKAGRRLFFTDVILDDGDPDDPFGRATATFINQVMASGPPDSGRFGDRPRPLPFTSFDEFFGPRFPDERTIEIDVTAAVTNGPAGTIQGGAQATLAEMAAEWALRGDGPVVATDLDISYLNRVERGPVAATADVVQRGPDGTAHVRVRLLDRGAEDRIVSFVTLECRPA